MHRITYIIKKMAAVYMNTGFWKGKYNANLLC